MGRMLSRVVTYPIALEDFQEKGMKTLSVQPYSKTLLHTFFFFPSWGQRARLKWNYYFTDKVLS